MKVQHKAARARAIFGAAAAAGAALTALAGPARADRAVVVGVQKYPALSERANMLQGCVNDARIMEKALKRYGFRTVLITDAQATKQGILDTIKREGGLVRPTEKFVFFFAGHGTDLPLPSLLPSDAREDSARNHLTRDELYNAVRSVPAYSRTVVLDACFSGGMAKSLVLFQRDRPKLRQRYYAGRSPVGRSPVPVPANGQDAGAGGGAAPPAVATSGEVCYYAAAMGNEKAMEDDFNGETHGAFTFYLNKRLDGKSDLWASVHQKVKSEVSDYLFDAQHPVLSPASYLQAPVFEAKDKVKKTADRPPVRHTLWDRYNADNADPSRVSVRIDPNKTTFDPHEPFGLKVSVGREGYLVVLERFVDKRIYLVYPKSYLQSRNADDARVKPGVRFDKRLEGDEAGTERVKAIWFQDKKSAEAVLKAFENDPNDEGIAIAQAKRLREVVAEAKPSQFFTSEITFEIAAPGGEGPGPEISATGRQTGGHRGLKTAPEEKITASAAAKQPRLVALDPRSGVTMDPAAAGATAAPPEGRRPDRRQQRRRR